jgi:hypothetical protein
MATRSLRVTVTALALTLPVLALLSLVTALFPPVAAAVVLLVPGIGLFVLPAGVAGATRMVVAADRASQAGPPCEPPRRRATT